MATDLSSKIQEKVQLLNKRVQDRKTQEIFEDEKITYDEIADILEVSEVQEQRAPVLGASPNYEEDYPSQNTLHYEKPKDIIISVLATMKSIAHTVQSKTRWDKFVSDRKQKGEEVFTLSSKGDFTNIHEVNVSMSRPSPPRHIVMCTHIKRMSDLIELVKYIEECSSSWKQPRKLRIYLDEFDKYIDRMRETIEELVLSNSVAKITIVTATPRKIWGNRVGWEKIFILNPRIDGDPDSYLMFKDCRHFNTDDINVEVPVRDWMDITGPGAKENIELINHHHKVTIKYPDIFTPGRVIFAPGNVSRKSHDLVRQLWNTGFKCSVAIINGERTMKGYYGILYIETGQAIDIPHMRYKDFKSNEMKEYVLNTIKGSLDDTDAQLNDIIADLYHTYNLDKTPLVITGRLCVERAQTLVHPVWGSFTDAIYFKALSPDDGYQQQRQLGHIKKWTTYRGLPRVFSPQLFRQDVELLEARADRFATEYGNRYATVQNYIQAGGGIMTSLEVKEKNSADRAETRSRITEHPTPFNNIKDVNKFLKECLGVKRGIHPFEKHGRYELSHRLNAYYKKPLANLVEEDRLTKEKYDRISKSLNIASMDKSGQHYMVYPVYPTMMSAPSEVQYYVCYLPNEPTHSSTATEENVLIPESVPVVTVTNHYHEFIKTTRPTVKAEHPDWTPQQIITELGRRWTAKKAETAEVKQTT
jgi:hypothetical protein